MPSAVSTSSSTGRCGPPGTRPSASSTTSASRRGGPAWEPAGGLEAIGDYAAREGLVLHVHADEQPQEIEQCLAEHGLRPIELLAETGCLGRRTPGGPPTHAADRELDLLA